MLYMLQAYNLAKEIDGQPQNKCYVILNNLQSGSNIGSICRNCLAFGVSEVLVVGRKTFKDKMRGADRGAKLRLNFTNFPTNEAAAAYLRQNGAHRDSLAGADTTATSGGLAGSCLILGIEITDGAHPITSFPFLPTDHGISVDSVSRNCGYSTAFMFGNEGGGLSKAQRKICDGFVYIPQYYSPASASAVSDNIINEDSDKNIVGGVGMASINVACASAIVLQSYAVWAKFREATKDRYTEKFL